jgi:hypothetical protein
MSVYIEMIPSPYDRLDPIARVVRWWTIQMMEVFAPPRRRMIDVEAVEHDRRVTGHLAIKLPETDAFVARLTLPKGPTSAHANAIRLRLADLAPIDLTKMQISATAIEQNPDGAVTYAVAMARRDRLDGLEVFARKKGARSTRFQAQRDAEADLKSPRTLRRDRRALIIDGAIVGAILASAVVAVVSWTARIERETSALAKSERSLRRAAVASEAARREADLAREFIDRGVLDRRAGAILETLSTLNKATPDGAWWTAVRWSPGEILISAQSNDATKAIEAMSKDAKAWTVELAGSIGGSGGQPQAFDLKLRPRQGGR